MSSHVINVNLADVKNPRAKAKKGLQERLSTEKVRKTEAELAEQQNNAETRRSRDLAAKVSKATKENEKMEVAQIKLLRSEASAQVRHAVRHAKAAKREAAHASAKAHKTADASMKRSQARDNAQTEKAKRDRAQADLEASLIPVHALAR